jgi:molybdopterin synthase catalytic subunit
MTSTTDDIFVAVQQQEIDSQSLIAAVDDPRCGAAALFLGIVRNHHEGKSVRYLEYEAYKAMAEKVMTTIVNEMRERWDVKKVAVVHRVGELQIGDVAVAVVVSTPHRKASFEACRYGIDEIKVRAPIWKKEFYEGGEHWVENCAGCVDAKAAHNH